jgi:serine/threonine protein kinase
MEFVQLGDLYRFIESTNPATLSLYASLFLVSSEMSIITELYNSDYRLKVVIDIAKGLRYLHRLHLIHRDLRR